MFWGSTVVVRSTWGGNSSSVSGIPTHEIDTGNIAIMTKAVIAWPIAVVVRRLPSDRAVSEAILPA